jgi:MFS family permease
MIGRVRSQYYGWRITAALAITETLSWGILYYAFSVFVEPTRAELGWSLATLTGAYSLALLSSGLCAPFVGRVIDRHGPRWIMTAGSLLGTIAVVVWSRADSVLAYYAAWVGIGVAMSATLYEPAFATLTRWFQRLRARAMLVVTIAAGFASTIFLPLSGILEASLGWRSAVLTLAVILGVVTIPLHALVLRRRPDDLGLAVDGERPSEAANAAASAGPVIPSLTLSEAMRGTTFWWLAVSFCLQSFATAAVALILIPYLVERGESPAFAASVAGLIGAAQVGARIVSTMAGTRVSPAAQAAGVFALQAVAVAVLLVWQVDAGILTAVILLGIGRGVVTLARPQLIAERFGAGNFGVISGTMAMFLTGANALAPIASGLLYGVTDDYGPVLWGMAGVSVLSTLTMLVVSGAHQRSASARLQRPTEARGSR